MKIKVSIYCISWTIRYRRDWQPFYFTLNRPFIDMDNASRCQRHFPFLGTFEEAKRLADSFVDYEHIIEWERARKAEYDDAFAKAKRLDAERKDREYVRSV